ncbi:MAG: SH3 domain-containing protein [Bacteroidia bacterium]|nr:SH3 domain-containing protein [Bacteroidia bacterium]
MMKWLLIFPVLWGGSATPEMTRADFWPASDEIVMTREQISAYNAELVEEGDLDLVDICSAGRMVGGSEVRSSICQYSIPRSYRYFDESRITNAAKKRILANRDLDGVKADVFVEYGIITTPADLRSFPTATTCTADGITSGSLCFDDFQQTHLWLGEGVLIWHESADGKWYYVRGRNYAGWVEAANIGRCNRDEMVRYVRSPRFAVTLEQKLVTVAGREMRLMMGTRLAKDENGAVLAPVRREDGTLSLVPSEIDIEMSDGYLPYTTANVLKLAFKLLGTPYSWGGAEGYNDCSATLLSVYYCFGIELPRNSSSMKHMDRNNHKTAEGPVDYASLLPGSIALVPGHAMMYIGCIDGEPYILHDVNALYSKDLVKDQRSVTLVSSCSDIYRKTGLSYTGAFTNLIEVR